MKRLKTCMCPACAWNKYKGAEVEQTGLQNYVQQITIRDFLEMIQGGHSRLNKLKKKKNVKHFNNIFNKILCHFNTFKQKIIRYDKIFKFKPSQLNSL